MQMNLEYKIVRGAEEFRSVKDQFIDLFQSVFDRPYPVERWKHFFEKIPCGPSQGIAVWDKERLVAFSGVLPQEFILPRSKELVSYGLSVATMIHMKYRLGLKTYILMMDKVKEISKETGFHFILAFPNDNLFPINAKIGKFILLDESRFVRGNGTHEGYSRFITEEIKKGFYSERLLQWRLQRFKYRIEQGCIIKDYNGEENILDWVGSKETQELSGIFPFWSSFGPCPFTPVDNHIVRMCYFPLQGKVDMDQVKRSLMYSDVF